MLIFFHFLNLSSFLFRGNIIFEASWALTNIASGDTHHTRSLVEHRALRVLVDLLEHPEVCYQFS